jgi:hypothetical protein
MTKFRIRTLLVLAIIVALACVGAKWYAERPSVLQSSGIIQNGNPPVDRFQWNEGTVGIATQRWEFGWRYAGQIPELGTCIVLKHIQPEHERYGQSGGYEVAIQLPLDVKVGDRFTLSPVPIDRKGEPQSHDRRYTLMLPGEFTAETFGDHVGYIEARSEIRASTITIKEIAADYAVLHAHIDVTIPEFRDLKLDRDFTTRRVLRNGG